MDFTAFDIDGREGTNGAEMLASTAADTLLLVDSHHVVAGAGIFDNGDGTSRTMARAGSAANALGEKAIVRHCDGVTYRDGALLRSVNLFDGTGGANLAAAGAIGAAEAFVEDHLGLHHGAEFGGRTKYFLGAFGHTQLTSGAMVGEMFQALRAKRFDGHLAFGELLAFEDSQSAIDLGFLSLDSHGSTHSGGGDHEFTTIGIHSFAFNLG